jgi:hypothetical protein
LAFSLQNLAFAQIVADSPQTPGLPTGIFEGNGLLLTPTIDHLFDRGFISFENSGELLISPVAHEDSLNKMGIITDSVVNVGGFAEPQKEFLEFHRDSVFLKREVN